MPRKRTFESWKKAAKRHAVRMECPDDLWDDDDPYDLKIASQHAFKRGQSPEDFIDEIFAEDIASRENDAQMAAEAMEYEDG